MVGQTLWRVPRRVPQAPGGPLQQGGAESPAVLEGAGGGDGTAATETVPDILAALQALGWVDLTAVALLLVFCVIGLFKGLFWQISRIGILLVAYAVAGRFGGDVGTWLAHDLARSGADRPATVPNADGSATTLGAGPDTIVYLSYLLVFLGVVIVLSLIAMQVQKMLSKSGMTFFDRLFGGVFGVATGACTVLALLFVVNMFFRETHLGTVVQASHSQRLSRDAINWLGPRVPDELRGALYLTPLRARHRPGGGGPADGDFAPSRQGPGSPEPAITPPATPPENTGTGR